jgi:hypothetical protein
MDPKQLNNKEIFAMVLFPSVLSYLAHTNSLNPFGSVSALTPDRHPNAFCANSEPDLAILRLPPGLPILSHFPPSMVFWSLESQVANLRSADERAGRDPFPLCRSPFPPRPSQSLPRIGVGN